MSMRYIGFIFLAGAILGWVRHNTMSQSSLIPKLDSTTAIAQVKSYFDNNSDPEIAYQLFIDTYGKVSDPLLTHNISHWVGERLYKDLGVDGVTICDDKFNYGCYHGFYGRAFSQEGDGLIGDAEEACLRLTSMTAMGGCIHGIGHGIVAYYGYTFDDLERSLILCDTLGNPGNQEGCYNGAFMEYNTRTMQGSQAVVRPLEKNNVLDPCPKLVDSRHQEACYLELPSWWVSLGMPLNGFFANCDKIGEISQKEICVSGIARMSPVILNFAVGKVGEYCLSLPDKYIYACAIKSGEVMLTNHSLNVHSICAIMEGSNLVDCQTYLKQYSCGVLNICEN